MYLYYNTDRTTKGQQIENANSGDFFLKILPAPSQFCRIYQSNLQESAAAVSSAQLYWVMNSPVKADMARVSPFRRR